MASYSSLLRRITTYEINNLLREGNYTRWSYFIDQRTGKVGVVYANDTTFAAYTVPDVPDPKLQPFGLEPIENLVMTPDDYKLLLKAGDNDFQAVVFNDPATVLEDELLPSFTYVMVTDWQRYLRKHGVQMLEDPRMVQARWVFIGVVAVLVLLLFYFLFYGPGTLH